MATITQLYLEKTRSKLSAKYGKEITDYRLAKELDIPQPTISRYFRANKPLEADDDSAYKIASVAEVPALEIIAKIHASRVKTPELKEMFSALAASCAKGNNGTSYILC